MDATGWGLLIPLLCLVASAAHSVIKEFIKHLRSKEERCCWCGSQYGHPPYWEVFYDYDGRLLCAGCEGKRRQLLSQKYQELRDIKAAEYAKQLENSPEQTVQEATQLRKAGLEL